jgi:hypothetical protein
MTTMVDSDKSSTRRPDQPNGESEKGFSVDARFDKVEADMREGFRRVDQSISDLRGEMAAQGESLHGEISAQGKSLRTELGDLRTEMNTRFLALSSDFNSLQRTMIGSAAAIVAALIGVKIF